MTRPILFQEQHTDEYATWLERWTIDPPPEGVQYRVLESEWTDDYTVRTIHRIELAP